MPRKMTSSDQVVGSRLRLRRKQNAMSEEQLAETLGVRRQEIAKYENGAARLGAEQLAAASKALDAPLSYFFAGLAAADTWKPDAPLARLLFIPGAAELLSAYSLIENSQLRGAVLKVVLRLARESRGRVSPTLARMQQQGPRSNSQAG